MSRSDAARRALSDAFAEVAAASAHPLLRCWYSDDALRSNFVTALAGDLARVDDNEAARAFREQCPVAGRDASEYRNRVVHVAADLDVLAGIRFRGLDVARPFVDWVASTRAVADAAEVESAGDRLIGEFEAFRPASVRFFTAQPRLASSRWTDDDVVLAGRVGDIRSPATDCEVGVLPVSAVLAYEGYARLYRAFHGASPGNAELSHMDDLPTLTRWEADGGLFEIVVDGEPAGFCGAQRWDRYGVSGWCASEIILGTAFRGRRLAAVVHGKVAAAIPARPGDALWAEIHVANVASWRSGLAAGYAEIGRVLQVPAR